MSASQETQTGGGHVALSLQRAVDEAQRCLLCHDAPCSQGCPGGTDPAKFIRQIRFYNFKGAARTVLGNNPLGGACAYVCPTDETCVRSGIDRPIDIDGLQAFAVEYGREHGVKAMEAGARRPHKVAVVGAGPAGLTAAARLAMYGYPVTVFEARKELGGMLRYGVPESRLDSAKLDADLAEIKALGVEFKTEHLIESEDGAAKLLADGFKAIFVAPGLWKPATLKLDGIELDGVGDALSFLEECRTDTAKARALVKDKNVAVIGGGSVAMDVARCARELGAGRIYAIALESMTELPAQADELGDALKDGVVIKPQCQVTRIIGEGGKVAFLEGHETEWIEPGKLVPQNARPIEGTHFKLKVGAVIQAIGQRPTDAVGKVLTSAKKQGALVEANAETQATSVAGVFAGGDLVRGAGTVVAAVGDGKRAADAIHRHLAGGKEVAS